MPVVHHILPSLASASIPVGSSATSSAVPARRPGIRATSLANSRVVQPSATRGPNIATSQVAITPSNGQSVPMRLSRARRLHTASLHSVVASRAEFAARAGLTFGGNRKLDSALGRLKTIVPENYVHRYTRGGIAGAIVDKLVNTALRSGATISQDTGTSTGTSTNQWDKEIILLFTKLRVWDVLREAFIECRKGRYSIIVIGAAMADNETLEQPLGKIGRDGINYLRAFGQVSITQPTKNDLIKDERSPLVGYPERYRVTLARGNVRKIHYTRVIHIADSLTPWGNPVLERIWDRLDDLDKVVGGGAEGTFQNIKRGAWNIDPDIDFESSEEGADGDIDYDELPTKYEDAIAAYRHGVLDDLILQGITPVDMKTQIPNISANAKLLMRLIAAASGYPERVLFGTEEGKLAGEQDSAAYADDVRAYREGFCERHVRKLLDRFIELGVIVNTPYTVGWSSAEKVSPVDKAAIVASYANANRRQSQADKGIIITPDEIRRDVLGYEELSQQSLDT